MFFSMLQSLTNARVIHVRMEERVRVERRHTHVLVQVDIVVIVAKQVGNMPSCILSYVEYADKMLLLTDIQLIVFTAYLVCNFHTPWACMSYCSCSASIVQQPPSALVAIIQNHWELIVFLSGIDILEYCHNEREICFI